MKCRDCGTNIDLEVHENYICYDCWSRAELAQYELEQKKTRKKSRFVPYTSAYSSFSPSYQRICRHCWPFDCGCFL
jgi:DNA-directed RNA polymerase subunit RPC12/RpoP